MQFRYLIRKFESDCCVGGFRFVYIGEFEGYWSMMICVEVCEKIVIDWWRFEVVRDKGGGGYEGLWWLWRFVMDEDDDG